MVTDRPSWIIRAQTVWMVGALGLLVAFGHFSLEIFFVVSFIGLLLLSQLFAPRFNRPSWWRRLRWTIRPGYVILGYLAMQQVMEVL